MGSRGWAVLAVVALAACGSPQAGSPRPAPAAAPLTTSAGSPGTTTTDTTTTTTQAGTTTQHTHPNPVVTLTTTTPPPPRVTTPPPPPPVPPSRWILPAPDRKGIEERLGVPFDLPSFQDAWRLTCPKHDVCANIVFQYVEDGGEDNCVASKILVPTPFHEGDTVTVVVNRPCDAPPVTTS
ncbi:hypothetical protein [Actinosynnema sp. NPDC020468]|uniref:hypothetical protein n=1 Tax=Actinosynnema sp. NPDC020468 TaxID=3154488 RepID=UPI0033DF1942